MGEIMRQNFAIVKGKIFRMASRQNISMPDDYRERLRRNVNALLTSSPKARSKLNFYYLSGSKKGKKVSERSVRNISSMGESSNAPNLDLLAAFASGFGLDTYHLFLPDLDPTELPAQDVESWIDREVERRLAVKWKSVQKQVRRLRVVENEEEELKRPVAPDVAADRGVPAVGKGRSKKAAELGSAAKKGSPNKGS